MDEITARACASSRTFRISSYEPSALYVPVYALSQLPTPDNFLVLPPDYTVTAVTPIALVHANVMPLFLNWSAYGETNQFIVTSAEVGAEILRLVARGETLAPGTTGNDIKKAQRPSSSSLITDEKLWLH